MRFLLVIFLIFTGAGQATAISTNGRIATLMQKVLPAKSAGMLSKKAGRFVAGAGFIGLALCGTITGCERGERILSGVVGVEGSDTVDDNNGQYIPPISQYIPLVDESQQAGQLLPELDSASFRVIPNHEAIGALIFLLGEINGKETQRLANVVDVYDNGYYKVEVFHEVYSDGIPITLPQPYTALVHRDNDHLPLKDGGFAKLTITKAEAGFRVIPNHEDVGAKIHQLHMIDDGQTIQRWGEVVEVYDNGYYRITVTREEYSYDGQFGPFQPFTMLIHQDRPWGEAGFIVMRRN